MTSPKCPIPLLVPSTCDPLPPRHEHRLAPGTYSTGDVTERIRQVGEAQVCTSIIVAAELRYGAERRGSRRLTGRLEAVLSALDVLPFEAPADEVYGALRTALERDGVPIGGNDLLIAAQGVALGYTVVTDNEREFSRVRGLALENWLRDR